MIPRYVAFLVIVGLYFSQLASAHHVLGRPAYSLNEDSNTPPSMAVETQIGQFFVTYMVFPAFPKANQPGRLNLYAARIDGGEAFDGEVSFFVRDANWLGDLMGSSEEKLGTQLIDDGVYRQGFVFNKDGSYLIRAYFEADGEPYDIDFPLQVGAESPIGVVGAAVTLLLSIILTANIVQGRRIKRAKMQSGARSRS
jgi:hypothetical protein